MLTKSKLRKKFLFSESNITPWSYEKKTDQSSSDIATISSESGDGEMVNGEFIKSHGMNWIVAALFLVGDMAGGIRSI
jgi:hypothetical protein